MFYICHGIQNSPKKSFKSLSEGSARKCRENILNRSYLPTFHRFIPTTYYTA